MSEQSSPAGAPVGKHLAIVAAVVAVAAAVTWAGSHGGARLAGVPVLAWQVGLAFLVQWVMFVHSWTRRTEHFYDLTGSVTYLVVTLFGLLAAGSQDARSILLALMVCAWAARLGTFLFRRVRRAGGDDRFREILRSPTRLLVTWTMQGLWVSLTALAAWIAMSGRRGGPLGWLDGLGLLVWLAGLAVEQVADAQKSAFRADPAHRGEFIRSGVWAWSRHPNYAGEIVLWVGVLLVAASALHGWQWVGLLSPVFVILLLTRVSGIPLLERKADERWGDREDYQRYKAQTPVLVPRPPRGPGR